MRNYEYFKNGNKIAESTISNKNYTFEDLVNIDGGNNKYTVGVKATTGAGKTIYNEKEVALLKNVSCRIYDPTYTDFTLILALYCDINEHSRLSDIRFKVGDEQGAIGINTFNVKGAQTYTISATATDIMGGEVVIEDIIYHTPGAPKVIITPSRSVDYAGDGGWYTSPVDFNFEVENEGQWGDNYIIKYQYSYVGESIWYSWSSVMPFILPDDEDGANYIIKVKTINTVWDTSTDGVGISSIKIDISTPSLGTPKQVLAGDSKSVSITFGTGVNYGPSGKYKIEVTGASGEALISDITATTGDTVWKANKNGTYTFQLTTNSGKTITKDVTISNIQTTPPKTLITWVKEQTTASGLYQEVSNGITNYRYEGPSPKNYIQFNGETWRIIGVFKTDTHGQTGENAELVKIIKKDFEASGRAWGSGNNNWTNNTLETYLNGTYYNSLTNTSIGNTQSKDLVQNVTWRLGGYSSADQLYVYTAEDIYKAERYVDGYGSVKGTNGSPGLQNKPIGLMFVSDYGYGATGGSNCPRTTVVYTYGNTSTCYLNNWLYSSEYSQWTIVHNSAYTGFSYNANTVGNGGGYSSVGGTSMYVRPVLYLKSTVLYDNGTGADDSSNIIKIKI